jgi:hypothetical protein
MICKVREKKRKTAEASSQVSREMTFRVRPGGMFREIVVGRILELDVLVTVGVFIIGTLINMY